ncbi:MAG: acyl-CoA dehydrogenase family protein [Candidatus Hydrogenedentes bacterium]|nr:acyl-CoA dehydrogenase family protein [Candidatus Hydrogenedentota bacterium]
MDFKDTPEEAEFRTQARTWLEKNAPKFDTGGRQRHRTLDNVDAALDQAKGWQAAKADAGFACISWPKEYGGRGSMIETVIWAQEESRFSTPRGFFEIGLGMAAPVLMMYATEEQKQRYLPKMRTAEEVWCQLFSEPSAGSDLAGLKTRAEQDGDEWVINGQKVWTSGAHYCDFGILVARHDPTVQKHIGLTYFFIDMKAPGIEIVRIKQISGGSNFCEVFFNDLRVPDAYRLGGIGDGWGVALTTLMNERLAVGDAPPPDFAELIRLAARIETENGPAIKNPAVRDKIADWYVQSQGLKYTKFRTITALSKGQTPGPEASIAKVVSASKLQDIASFAMDLQGMSGIVTDPDLAPDDALHQDAFLYAPGFRIAGGTDEILRNIIGERVLGLPADIRVDKKLPFNQLPTGAAQ